MSFDFYYHVWNFVSFFILMPLSITAIQLAIYLLYKAHYRSQSPRLQKKHKHVKTLPWIWQPHMVCGSNVLRANHFILAPSQAFHLIHVHHCLQVCLLQSPLASSGDALHKPTLMYLCLKLLHQLVIPAKARDYVFTGVGLSVCVYPSDHDN